MDRKRPMLTYLILSGSAALLLVAVLVSPRLGRSLPSLLPTVAKPSPPPAQRPQVEMVFALDTTGSMRALLQGAKKKIWEIVRFAAQGQPAPELRIGLVGYRDLRDEYVTRFYDLTDDLDAVYQNLSAFTASGGGDTPEHVAKALHEAVHRSSWSQGPHVLRIVYLVGDAPPHTDYRDGFDHRAIALQARERGIRINTIRCGTSYETELAWTEIAGLAGGEFASIDQSGGMVDVSTPFDEEMARLNRQLTETALGYGSAAERSAFHAKAEAAMAAPLMVQAERAGFFGLLKGRGKTAAISGGDLLEDVATRRVDLDKIDAAALPEELRTMSTEERKAFVAQKAHERARILEAINALSRKRDAYLKAHQATASSSFDAKVRATLKKQAADIGIDY
ncbi:MAG: vWA domain-containing protein [Myxococcales bacterium]|nr:VWA domain-containing protein [Myxococcota bacterium]MDW8280675.1 vWA domain-containing protein [Myxococcales bacterium]